MTKLRDAECGIAPSFSTIYNNLEVKYITEKKSGLIRKCFCPIWRIVRNCNSFFPRVNILVSVTKLQRCGVRKVRNFSSHYKNLATLYFKEKTPGQIGQKFFLFALSSGFFTFYVEFLYDSIILQ